MRPAKLVDMLNRIAAFYEAMPDPDQACADVASHVKRFWDPRMRADLFAWIDAGQPADGEAAPVLRPLAARALEAHRATLVG